MLKLAIGAGTIAPASLDINFKTLELYFSEKLQLFIPIDGMFLISTGTLILSPAFTLTLPISILTIGLSVTVMLPSLNIDSIGVNLLSLIPENAPTVLTLTEYFPKAALCLILNLTLAKVPSFFIDISPWA